MMHVHYFTQNVPAASHAYHAVPFAKPVVHRYPPSVSQQPSSPGSPMQGHKKGDGESHGRGRSNRKPQGFTRASRNNNSRITRRNTNSLNDYQGQILYGATSGFQHNFEHAEGLANGFGSNYPFGQGHVISRVPYWNDASSVRSPSQLETPTHVYSMRPGGHSHPATCSSCQDHNFYGPSSFYPHAGGMVGYPLNSEVVLASSNPQYELHCTLSDQVSYQGQVSEHHSSTANLFTGMQGFSGDSPYTTSTFASPSPTALPTSNPTYPSDLNSIGNPIAPVARFSTPWGYVNFAPSPTSGQSGLLGHEATVQTQFSGHQEGYQPTLVDDQDDVEVVLGNPDRISETESTASNGSNAKRVEIMALEDNRRDQLCKQLEWYFSPRNLMVDKYLLSQMDKEQFIPISVIAGFKKVKALTSDVDEIVKALQKSPLVIVNEEGTMVKPNIVKRPRTTLILRDLPLETTEEEIRQLFESGQCSPKTITKEVGNNWFVDFATEEEALAMLAFTRGKCIRDVPIAGRLKSTTALAGVDLRTHSNYRAQGSQRRSSQDFNGGRRSSNFSDCSQSEVSLQYRRFPADEHSYVPCMPISSSEEGQAPGDPTQSNNYNSSESSIQCYQSGRQMLFNSVPPSGLDQPWTLHTLPYPHGRGYLPSTTSMMYPPSLFMSGGLAEGSGSSHSSSNRRNDGPGFKTTTATRRIGETRKRGRKGSQSHRHQQHQQNRRDQNAPVNQHRRDTSPVGSSHLSGEQLPDRSERLMMIEGITRPTTEMAIQGCDAGLSAPPYNICPTVGPVLGTECDGFRITSTKTSKVAVASSLSPSPMPNIPKYQKAERTHTHADFCEQYTTRAIRNRSTQVQGPQDLTTEDASGTPDDTSTTADDASQVSSRSESSTTVVDRSEQEEINVSINELASAVSQISFKANIHAGELSVMSNRSLSDEDNQSDQAGFPSWHSSPVDHPEGYSAQLAPSLQGNMRDHQQPLVKASSGHPSVDHIDHHQKDKDLKRISEQRSQIQVNGSGSQRQQGQKHSVSSNHRRSNAHRQGQERHHRSSNPSSALQASSTTRQKAVAPSLSDETLFPPMKATLVSNVARTSTSTQFSRGFSYASALKQPVQSETPSSESV